MNDASTITIAREGPLTIVTIARETHRNAVDPKTAAHLRAAFAAFEDDDEQRVAILTGAGTTFCAGYDLKSLAVDGFTYDPIGDGPMGPTRTLLSKPTIAAIEGYAVAGGLELALWCDLRVASESAIFGVFCRRYGVPLIDGGTVRLPRLIGQSRALDMILTGRPVDAREALSFGLANRVVPLGHALAAAKELALAIAAFPQTCMKTDRASAYAGWNASLDVALRSEGIAGERPLREEARAGANRFARGAEKLPGA